MLRFDDFIWFNIDIFRLFKKEINKSSIISVNEDME